jgi:hypothetical protein
MIGEDENFRGQNTATQYKQAYQYICNLPTNYCYLKVYFTAIYIYIYFFKGHFYFFTVKS